MKKYRFLFGFLVLFLDLFSVPALACSPVESTPENEAALIENVDAIVTLKVIDVDSGASSGGDSTASVEIVAVYKGSLTPGQRLSVVSRNYGTCSHFLTAAMTQDIDILLYKEGNTYFVAPGSDFLSAEAWLKLKRNRLN